MKNTIDFEEKDEIENLEFKDRKNLNILCMDGGGMKGVIMAQILHQIEIKTQKPTRKIFDYIAGILIILHHFK